MNAVAPIILPLDSTDAPLAIVGGKGRSLANLVSAGFSVPSGFLITTSAYKDFIEANRLQKPILEVVAEANPHQAATVELASDRIRSLFQSAILPTETAESISQAYSELARNEPTVAVRSSATAEDLPDLSFAGQQDSYLNVSGRAAVLDAVRSCWASLWTSRAILYRMRMEIDQRTIAMGVVVQLMVDADVSGVLFTANPSTGDRSELVVNSSYGLGEAIVGSHVTPDSYVLDRAKLEPKETAIASKEVMIVSSHTHGTATQPVPETQRDASSLPSESLTELATLCIRVEELLGGVPQDIEWAVAAGKCWLLQSRPITNLPPAPLKDIAWDPPAVGVKLIRRQVVENMPDPLSPLFAELYLSEGLEHAIDHMVADLKMPFKIEDFVDRPFFLTVNGFAYCRASYRSTWRLMRILPRVLFWYATSFRSMVRNMVPRWRDERLPAYLNQVEQWKAVDPGSATDHQLLAGVRALAVADAVYWFDATMVLALAKVTDGLLNRYLKSWFVRSKFTSGNFLRGFPSKVVQAQEDLEAIAGRVHTSESLRDLVAETAAADLIAALGRNIVGHALRDDIQRYLQQYGHQIYTLDFVQPTQIEDPLPVLLSLKELAKDDSYNSVSKQTQMARERESQVQETLESLGPLRRWLFRTFLRWAQTYGPYREESLFYLGAAWPTLRRMALELGQRLVAAGTLHTPSDVFYLDSSELTAAYTAREQGLAGSGLGQLAESRRELREQRKKLHPPGMVPQKSKFKLGPFDFTAFETQKRNATDANTLNGFAVSPGKVTGIATVILSPTDFENMKPNTILVCPTTTPAWTPLFSQASGLATDIGGILAHGSIVAREYGIPAVMGTGNVTRRVVSGQEITVDGDSGTVTILS